MRTFEEHGICSTKHVPVVEDPPECPYANFCPQEMSSATTLQSIMALKSMSSIAFPKCRTYAYLPCLTFRQHIFPILSRKMACFKPDQELLTQHKGIHEGLDKFEAYVKDCKSGERELRMEEMKEVMDSFGKVLWQHLDDEVKALRAENMRLYWSKEEMMRLPM